MRLYCTSCGKRVSSEVPEETIVRAALTCPECVPAVIAEDRDKLAERLFVAAIARHGVYQKDDRDMARAAYIAADAFLKVQGEQREG